MATNDKTQEFTAAAQEFVVAGARYVNKLAVICDRDSTKVLRNLANSFPAIMMTAVDNCATDEATGADKRELVGDFMKEGCRAFLEAHRERDGGERAPTERPEAMPEAIFELCKRLGVDPHEVAKAKDEYDRGRQNMPEDVRKLFADLGLDPSKMTRIL